MKTSEVIKLAMAGFKASDIKALMEAENKEAEEAAKEQEEKKELPEEPVKEPEEKVIEPQKDFEALYIKALDEVADLKNKLDAAQSANRSEGRLTEPPTLTDEFKKVQELFRR